MGLRTNVHRKRAHNGAHVVCEQGFVFCHSIGNVVLLNQVKKICVEAAVADCVNDLLDPIPDLIYGDVALIDLEAGGHPNAVDGDIYGCNKGRNAPFNSGSLALVIYDQRDAVYNNL